MIRTQSHRITTLLQNLNGFAQLPVIIIIVILLIPAGG